MAIQRVYRFVDAAETYLKHGCLGYLDVGWGWRGWITSALSDLLRPDQSSCCEGLTLTLRPVSCVRGPGGPLGLGRVGGHQVSEQVSASLGVWGKEVPSSLFLALPGCQRPP